MCNILHTNEMGLENNMHVFQTSSLDSFQSSFTSISLKESCDLGPFLISMSSMSKMSVLLGGILPASRTDQVSETPLQRNATRVEALLQVATSCRFYLNDTFSFFAIGQSWRDGQLPAFPCAHILQAFIPAWQHLSHPKSEPQWIFVPIFTAAKSHRDQSIRGFFKTRSS